MSVFRFTCPACGTLTNSTRCPSCGSDTQDIAEDFAPRENYGIFDHAQYGHLRPSDASRNTLARAAGKHLQRRFSGAALTGFGGLQ